MAQVNPWEKAARSAWRPPSRVPPWIWAEEHVTADKTSPFPGRFRRDTAPWMNDFLSSWPDNSVRQMAMRCSAQSGKTHAVMVGGCWSIAEDPGPMLWVLAAQDEAKTFSQTRLMPTFEACPPVAAMIPRDRGSATTCEINFAQSPFVMTGANSESKLQSKPIRWLILDEVRNYPPGALEMVMKRVTSWWNSRTIIISTADIKGDAVDRAFESGDQRHYYVPCPHCGQEQELVWRQLKWDETEETRPGGVDWNFDALSKTIRYECIACSQPIKDEIGMRRKMGSAGRWIAHNRNASSDKRSWTFSALVPWWIRWAVLVEEFLRAKDVLELGVTDPMKSFINERLGESWEEHAAFAMDTTLASGIRLNTPLENEEMRLVTVDVQKEAFWYVARSWNLAGESRLLDCGKLATWDDVRATAERISMGSTAWTSRNVIVDCGYNTNEVYERCCQHGWTAFKGEDRDSYPVYDENGMRSMRPVAGEPIPGDPGMGTAAQGMRACPVFLWSNPTVKDILHRLRNGKGRAFEVPEDVPPEYLKQMRSEAKVQKRDKAGYQHWRWEVIGRRPNHLWDCENMQVAGAIIQGILPATVTPATSQKAQAA